MSEFVLEPVWRLIQRQVFRVSSTLELFNHYRDQDYRLDVPGAPAIRRANLRQYLASFRRRPTVLLLSLAPGRLGCRFSGIPFTSESQLLNGVPIAGRQSSRDHSLLDLGQPTPYHTRPASIFWEALGEDYGRVLLWNCLPLIPYPIEDAVARQRLTAEHYAPFSDVTRRVVDMVNPRIVVALGRDAEKLLQTWDVETTFVPSPSARDGGRGYRDGIAAVLDCR